MFQMWDCTWHVEPSGATCLTGRENVVVQLQWLSLEVVPEALMANLLPDQQHVQETYWTWMIDFYIVFILNYKFCFCIVQWQRSLIIFLMRECCLRTMRNKIDCMMGSTYWKHRFFPVNKHLKSCILHCAVTMFSHHVNDERTLSVYDKK